MLNLGLFSPVLQQVPGLYADWEREGTIRDACKVAEAADRAGYSYLACAEHIAVTAGEVAAIGSRWWDPLATFGYLAAHTSRIRFATLVLVLPFHHPLDIVKRYGTLDEISEGRLIIGIGSGSQSPEFDLLGFPLADRGERTDDTVRALRASFGNPEPVYEGTHYRFADVRVEPCGVQRDVPIWVGGRTRRSLRRAVELGDAWCPYYTPAEQIATWLAEARGTEMWERRAKPLEVALSVKLDPLGAPEQAKANARALRDAGATALSLRFVHDSPEHCVEQVEAMVGLAASL
jgi:probable F420-dependent oxidoreductase